MGWGGIEWEVEGVVNDLGFRYRSNPGDIKDDWELFLIQIVQSFFVRFIRFDYIS